MLKKKCIFTLRHKCQCVEHSIKHWNYERKKGRSQLNAERTSRRSRGNNQHVNWELKLPSIFVVCRLEWDDEGISLHCSSHLAGGWVAACIELAGGSLWYVWHLATNSSVSPRKEKRMRPSTKQLLSADDEDKRQRWRQTMGNIWSGYFGQTADFWCVELWPFWRSRCFPGLWPSVARSSVKGQRSASLGSEWVTGIRLSCIFTRLFVTDLPTGNLSQFVLRAGWRLALGC